MASLTDVFFWRSEKSLKNVSFYSPNRLMFTRNWSKKTLFRELVFMEDTPSELVASNQQIKNQHSGQYVSCNICQRVFKTNWRFLQHLRFCRKRKRGDNINPNTEINDSNNKAAANYKSDSYDSNGNWGYETYF